MTPSGGSRISGPKASKDVAGFHGRYGVPLHLPNPVIAVQTEYRPLGNGMLCSRHLTSKSPAGKRPWCFVMNMGKAVPNEMPTKKSASTVSGELRVIRTSASSSDMTGPPSGPVMAALSMRTMPSLEVAIEASSWIDDR